MCLLYSQKLNISGLTEYKREKKHFFSFVKQNTKEKGKFHPSKQSTRMYTTFNRYITYQPNRTLCYVPFKECES